MLLKPLAAQLPGADRHHGVILLTVQIRKFTAAVENLSHDTLCLVFLEKRDESLQRQIDKRRKSRYPTATAPAIHL